MKAPGFGERKSSYLEDIAILTGAQVIKEELGLSLDKVSAMSLLCATVYWLLLYPAIIVSHHLKLAQHHCAAGSFWEDLQTACVVRQPEMLSTKAND